MLEMMSLCLSHQDALIDMQHYLFRSLPDIYLRSNFDLAYLGQIIYLSMRLYEINVFLTLLVFELAGGGNMPPPPTHTMAKLA